MSEKSFWWTTGGAGDGASTYTRSDLSEVARVLAATHAAQGVAPGYLDSLAGSAPAANTVQIASGGALVDGKPYVNHTVAELTVPSAAGAGNSRIDRIALRANWTAQTVRVVRVAGVDAVDPAPPALTQTPGVVYDLALYQARVDTGGNVTLSDERAFARLGAGGLAADVFPYQALGDLALGKGDGTLGRLAAGVNAQKLVADSLAEAGLRWIDDDFGLSILIGNGVEVVTSGVKGYIEAPFDCEIEAYRLVGDASGSITIDLWRDSFANFPPSSGDSICGTTKPNLNGEQRKENSSLIGWSRTLSKGDWLAICVESATTVKQVTLSLTGRKRAVS